MKTLRFFLGLILAAGVLGLQLPVSAGCQGLGIVKTAMVCQMPCCKTNKLPLNCPMVKAAPVHDVIASAPVSFTPLLTALAAVDMKIILTRLLRSYWVMTALQTLSPVPIAPAILTRAPPADSHLLSA